MIRPQMFPNASTSHSAFVLDRTPAEKSRARGGQYSVVATKADAPERTPNSLRLPTHESCVGRSFSSRKHRWYSGHLDSSSGIIEPRLDWIIILPNL